MKIAVTYNDGEVFQHFGHTEEFKVYDVEDSRVVSSEVIGSNGTGHGALAGLLADKNIDVLICGGIGGGAMSALSENGIEVCAGANGNTDDVVDAYLNGNLVSSGVNCDHHGEGHSCGDHEDGHSCGHHGNDEDSADAGCGGCSDEEGGCASGGCGGCSGCHSGELTVEGPNAGKVVKAHYIGTFNDGTQFDSSYDRGEPLEFVCGAGMMIKGFDAAVANMEVGEVVDVHLMPSEAYGEPDPRAVFQVEIAQMPGAEQVSVGQQVYLQNMNGQPFPVKVVAKDEKTVTFDANHEMAGKELNFRIELVEVL
jgi:FKBP-type peptidyl-prolyl cis-trans isomerase 2